MTGEIIQFRSHRDFKRGRNTQILELEVARIADLMEELEELSCTSGAYPLAILTRARTGMETARRVLRTLSRSEPRGHLEDDSEGDPQPEIDHEQVDRMYRDLNSDGVRTPAGHDRWQPVQV